MKNGLGFLCLLLFLFASCSTYYIKITELEKTFSQIDSTTLTQVKIQGIYDESYTYLSNSIDSIAVFTRKNEQTVLNSNPSLILEIRSHNNKKYSFYFDRIFIKDSLLIGVDSRKYPVNHVVAMKNIKDIKCYDSKKGYKYIKD